MWKSARLPPALKHGCYSGLALLPTEDRAAFDKHNRELIAEYGPAGRSEELIVANLARLTWRRENLTTYLLAKYARGRHSAIYSNCSPQSKWDILLPAHVEETRSPEELAALRKSADERAQRDLGPALELLEIGEVATSDHLLEEISLAERLDGAIVRCIKQLLLVRGVKSMSLPTSAGPMRPRISRVA
jgi:hypothetical protein